MHLEPTVPCHIKANKAFLYSTVNNHCCLLHLATQSISFEITMLTA